MHRIARDYLRLFVVYLFCQCAYAIFIFADTTDFFPLERSLHCLYQYEHQYHSWSYGAYSTAVDSGTIEYVVLDSSHSDDTTITWYVREHRRVLHHLVRNVPGLDTTYSTSDTLTSTVTESTTGHHELHSRFLIWEFPLQLKLGDTIHIDRYGDGSQLILTGSASICAMIVPPFSANSASFSIDSGLIVIQKYFCFENDPNGSYDRTNANLTSRIVTKVNDNSAQPTQFILLQNYPNPFNPTTTISFNLPHRSHVSLLVYNVLGVKVQTLIVGDKNPGSHDILLDGTALASGVYYYRLQAAEYTETKKLLLIR